MQEINREQQQQANVRLSRQLPANIIKEKTLPIDQKHIKKNSQSQFNQQQWSTQNIQTDLSDFDTHRSLSTCPTYSSLSRHSPETRECATQITTTTPIQTIDDNQEISDDSLLPIDNNQVLLVNDVDFEEVELMPISSGFGYYPYNYPTTKTDRVPQIIARAPQFRTNQNGGLNGNSKTNSNGKLPPPRPTAVKGSPRSDTSLLPIKRNEINPKGSKTILVQNGSRRQPPKETVVRSATPPPPPRKHSEAVYKNGSTRPLQKRLSSPPTDPQNGERKPIRFVNKHNTAYKPSSPPPPAHYQKSNLSTRDPSERPRRIRIADNGYVIQRRRQPAPEYIYDDHRTESPIERTRPHRVIRVIRDPPYREDSDDVYYAERAPSRRPKIIRRSSPTEYVYLDEKRTPTVHHRRSRRPAEVVYIDDDQPIEYEDDYIYVDEDGNEVDIINDRNHSPSFVEYVDDDEKDKRRTHKSKIIYVDDKDEKDKRRTHKPKIIYVDDDNDVRIKRKSKAPSSSTKIVYE